jgi:serine/threonine protein kinase
MAEVAGPGCIEMLEVFEGAPPHGAGLDDGSITALFEVSTWVEGRRFDRWAADRTVTGADRLSVLSCLAAVIERLHDQSVIHRDIAPGNVIVDARRATLIDFGLAARLFDDGRIIETEAIGTPGFRSPEAELGAWSVAADRWSFGSLCQLALDGYGSKYPAATNVIAALLSDEPGDRPPLSLVTPFDDV